MFCKNCGKEIDDKAAICVHCGVATNNDIKMEGNEWLITLLLCLVLGFLGAHRFYTGYMFIGSVQLALLTVGWLLIIPGVVGVIWIVIDLINILIGNFKTSDGKLLTK